MSKPVIIVDQLSKSYQLGAKPRPATTFREAVTRAAASPFRRLRHRAAGGNGGETFWALRDVSLDVARGEVIGIIGRNGAGKSTLLKILTRITEPTAGRIRMRGRVAALLEVGTGFHPELTGRENIFLNGAILGMKRAEIARRFDAIAAFAEVDKFLDTPVKWYSSGMYVRLAFAVAAHLEPEVLIVDEVLAVGDAEFQKKCLGRMHEVSAGDGRTVLFVSHNMAAVAGLCSRAVLLEGGQVAATGPADEVIGRYLGGLHANAACDLAGRSDRSGSGAVRLTGFHMEDFSGRRLQSLASGQDVVFVFAYACAGGRCTRPADVGFSFQDMYDNFVFVLYSSYVGQRFTDLAPEGCFRCAVRRFPLARGRYTVGARVFVGREEADWPRDGIGRVDVADGDFFGTGSSGFEGRAPMLLSGDWSLTAPI
jgi:lipopolysaccharide transport system ATP-binding protein